MFRETEITGVKKVSVKSDFDPEDGGIKHTMSVSVEIGQEDQKDLQTLAKMKGRWSITLRVENDQMEFSDVTPKDKKDGTEPPVEGQFSLVPNDAVGKSAELVPAGAQS